MPLIKTLSQTLKQDKEKFKVPKSVQQAIPIRKIWPDGIFQVESKYSRTFRFTDINYSIASKADKTEMFLDYSELLNALDSGCTAKITLNNRKINKDEFEQSLLIPMKGDGLDEYRKEYNDMLLSKISGTNNSIYQERYLTISVHKKNIDEARTYFARVGTDIITHLAKLSSIGEVTYCFHGRVNMLFSNQPEMVMSDHYISVFNGASHLKSCDFGEEPFVGVSVVAYLPQIINSLNIMLGTIAFDEDMDFQGLFTAGGCFIAPAKKSVEHIFTELLLLPEQYRNYLMRIKVMELLLYLVGKMEYRTDFGISLFCKEEMNRNE